MTSALADPGCSEYRNMRFWKADSSYEPPATCDAARVRRAARAVWRRGREARRPHQLGDLRLQAGDG